MDLKEKALRDKLYALDSMISEYEDGVERLLKEIKSILSCVDRNQVVSTTVVWMEIFELERNMNAIREDCDLIMGSLEE